MRKSHLRQMIVVMALTLALAVPAHAVISADTVEELSDLLVQAPSISHWQFKADVVYGWMQEKKTDFVIVDVRPSQPG